MSQQALAIVRPLSSLSAMADRSYIEAALRGEYDAVAASLLTLAKTINSIFHR